MLQNKNVLLGVCGSIASYKSATLVRLLVKAGANVKVIMTQDAGHFITPLTLATLSKNPVLTNYFDPETGVWSNHVELGIWADLLLVAPVSANTVAKFAAGLCDNLLSAVYLSARCSVYLAPAMDLDMWKHEATQKNIQDLLSRGNILIRPQFGELASGLIGEGRMAEPEEIVGFLTEDFKKKAKFNNKRVLITAGPTYEAIDPVRFIGNHSSGKMGFAIAEEFADLGAEVILIAGPVSLTLKHKSIRRVDVTSADEMLKETQKYFPESHISVLTAAVADYRPKVKASQKIKKKEAEFDLKLEKTTDILAGLGNQKTTQQILVGFALETENEIENAIRKLHSKNLDMVVLNSLNDQGAAFRSDQNKITIITRDEIRESYELKPKHEVAKDICSKIFTLIR